MKYLTKKMTGLAAALACLGGVSLMAAAPANASCGTAGSPYCDSWTQAGTSAQSFSAVSMPQNYSTGSLSYGQVTNVSMLGLGAGERLCKVECPVSVDLNPGERVLDCFAVCKPKPQPHVSYQTYTKAYQVVRPVIYVRYPVPVYVPPAPRPTPMPCMMAPQPMPYYGPVQGCRR